MQDSMTGRERVLAVLARTEPDRVPTFEWDIDSSVIAALTGGTYEDFVEAMDLDAIMVSPNYRDTPLGEGLIRDEWGAVRRKGHEDYLMAMDEWAPVRPWDDLETWNPPDPCADGRFASLQQRVKRFKGRKAIFIRPRDAFSNPRDLMAACWRRHQPGSLPLQMMHTNGGVSCLGSFSSASTWVQASQRPRCST